MMKHYPVHSIDLSNGETIAFRQAGDNGKTVLLVHGNMSSSVHWQTTMEHLEKTHQVYALDLRGFGDSSYNNDLNSLRDFSEDVMLFIKALDLTDVTLVGWSTGGGIVLETAADLPDRIEKVIVLDSVGIKGYPILKKDATGQPIAGEFLTTKEDIAVDPVQVLPILSAYKNKDRDFIKLVWNSSIYNLNQPEPDDYEHYIDAILKQRNLVDVDFSLAMFNMTDEHNGVTQGSGRLDWVHCPLVILHGDKDLVVPIASAYEMKEYFGEKATLVVFENVGHSVITDDLDLFVETLKNHIN